MRKIVVVAALFVVISCGMAFGQSDSIFVPGFGPFVPNFGFQPCFFGGQLLIGGEFAEESGVFNLNLLRRQCIIPRFFGFGVGEVDSADNRYMSDGMVNAKGSFSRVSDKVVRIDMTSTLPLTFTHKEMVFRVNCAQILKGLFDLESEVFDGDINVACNGLGKIESSLTGLATEIFPH